MKVLVDFRGEDGEAELCAQAHVIARIRSLSQKPSGLDAHAEQSVREMTAEADVRADERVRGSRAAVEQAARGFDSATDAEATGRSGTSGRVGGPRQIGWRR